MADVSPDLVERAVAILGTDGIAQDAIEADVLALAGDAMLARRLIDWPPEAFGLLLAGHHFADVTLPKRFSVRAGSGEWREFEFSVEPIFVQAFSIAMRMYHQGPRATFENVASRSSTISAINRAIDAGGSLAGATLSGPALKGIPADVYLPSGGGT
jgi:hypothetical protein